MMNEQTRKRKEEKPYLKDVCLSGSLHQGVKAGVDSVDKDPRGAGSQVRKTVGLEHDVSGVIPHVGIIPEVVSKVKVFHAQKGRVELDVEG